MLEREFGIKIENPTEARKILSNINEMSSYIIANSNRKKNE